MTSFTVPLAFGFGSLAMLGWLAAASAPLIIHLWNRRKYREVPWAAVDFLLAAMRRNARRIQLHQWLLLALRMMLIAVVVLAMAEPFWEQMGLTMIGGQRTHKVVVIDGSFSMAYRPSDISRFAWAKQLARQIVEQSSQGDGFTLVLLGDPPRTIVATPALAPHDFIEEIEALKMPHAGGDVPAALALVEEILQRARRENPGLTRHEVYFLTDLGRNSWVPDGTGGAENARFHGQVEELARRASLTVLDLGQSGSENMALTGLRTSSPLLTIRNDVTFEVQVRNYGTQRRARQLVELLVDETRVKEESIDVEPGGEATLSFAHRFETPGHHVVKVRLAGDLLDVDNHRWLSVPVKPHLRVLCVSGKQGSAHYLTNALDPEPSDRSLVRPEVVPESALLELDLSGLDCIFLSNVAQFTAGEARQLDSYLKQGGGLVFFLGDRVMADRYNRLLAGEEADGVRVLPARIGPMVSAGSATTGGREPGQDSSPDQAAASMQFDPLDYRHPIVAPFRGRERAGLLTTPVYHYLRLEPIAERKPPRTAPAVESAVSGAKWNKARVALAFAGGDPAIVEESLHGGRSILVATAASLDSVDPATQAPWTTMPAWPSFVPIVHELLAYAVGSADDQFNIRVGETLGGFAPMAAAGTSLVARPPDGQNEPVRIIAEVDLARWTFADTDQSGVYWVGAADESPVANAAGGRISPLDATIPYSVNVDTSESDLTKAEYDELPSALEIQTDWQNIDERPSAEISRRSGLHKTLLYGALVLLLVETFLAQSLGTKG